MTDKEMAVLFLALLVAACLLVWVLRGSLWVLA